MVRRRRRQVHNRVNINAIKTIVFVGAGTIIYGLLNLVFHWWTDWHLGLFLGRQYDIDLSRELYKHYDFVILNSLYLGQDMGMCL